MNATLITPRWPAGSLWSNVVFRFPYLSLTALAALAPPEVSVRLLDENAEDLDWNVLPDIVGISLMTPLAPRGYEIADAYRKRGVPVVLGGVHATMAPEEAAAHADAVVIGEAERLWPLALADAAAGRLQPVYREDSQPSLDHLPAPRRELLKRKAYFFINTVQATRGCPHDCEFCSVTQFHGHTHRLRPIEEIEREISAFGGGFVFFVDDNIIGDRTFAKELFRAIAPYRLKWASQCSITMAKDAELLRLAAESGCMGLFIGFESLSSDVIKSMGKTFNRVQSYGEMIRRIHAHGIGIQGSFIFGNDGDNPSVFEETVRFTEKARLDAALFSILTPFPGTRIHARMQAEGRIFDRDWSHYDMNHVVFEPRGMSRDQLQRGFNWAYSRLYSWSSIFRRLWGVRHNLQLFGPQNFGFRQAWKATLKDEFNGR